MKRRAPFPEANFSETSVHCTSYLQNTDSMVADRYQRQVVLSMLDVNREGSATIDVRDVSGRLLDRIPSRRQAILAAGLASAIGTRAPRIRMGAAESRRRALERAGNPEVPRRDRRDLERRRQARRERHLEERRQNRDRCEERAIAVRCSTTAVEVAASMSACTLQRSHRQQAWEDPMLSSALERLSIRQPEVESGWVEVRAEDARTSERMRNTIA